MSAMMGERRVTRSGLLQAQHATLVLAATIALAAACACPGLAGAAPANGSWPGVRPEVVDAAIAAVTPALVKIDVVTAEYSEGREQKYEASGSGAIITPEGHVITNHHVAGEAKRIVCTMANKEQIEAELVGSDPLSDIAVIKLTPKQPRKFIPARFGDSSALKVGDRVLAMGSPLAFSQSVTMGIVANTQLVMPRDRWEYRITLDGEDVGSIVTWIAHDAAIYGGNSGGPLVNLRGEIVGINELRMGLSGAIPSNLAKEVALQLMKSGEVARAWLGLEVQPRLQEQASQRGVLVSGTLPGSPAEKAGFHPGDFLVRLAGHDVNVQFREELALFNRLVFALPIGAEAAATVMRDGKPVELQVRTEKRERTRPQQHELKRWGLCARNLSLITVKEMGLDSRDGVLITSVRAGGPAGEARPALTDRDVIVRVGDSPVNNLDDLTAATNRLTAGADSPVPTLVTFLRGKGRYLTVVKVGIKELEDPGREVRKAWLPVTTQVLTREVAQALGAPDRTGVVVTRVYPGSTAAKAGLQIGDIITALNGDPILAAEAQDVEVLPAMVRQLRIGASAELTVLRAGKESKLPVELAPSPLLAREMKRYRDESFEFTARDVTFLDRAEQTWEPQQAGVLVQEVGQGGWAALANLSAGDLIVAVDGTPVSDVVGLEKILKDLAQRQPDSVVLQVVRGIHDIYMEMRPAWRDVRPRPGPDTGKTKGEV